MLLLRFFLRIYNLHFSPDKNLAARIRDMTGFVPARLAIFKLAFSHKSNQNRGDLPVQTNNERLEYLGDAVLGTIVAEYLFKKYPNGNEGFLTKMRSKIVKRNSLNRIGDEMGLDVLLTEYNSTRLSSSMLGNAVEALVGAVYLEKGYGGTKRFVIRRMLRNYVDMDHLEAVDDNYKSQLLEYCQKNGRSINYQIVSKYKHERRDRFKIGVVIGGETVATADDFNKKAAEQLASRKALVKMGVLESDAESGAALPVKRGSKRRALIVDEGGGEDVREKPVREARKSARPKRQPSEATREPEIEEAAIEEVAVAARVAIAQPEAVAQPEAAPQPEATAQSTEHPKRSRRQRKPSVAREIGHAIRVSAASLFAVDELGRGPHETNERARAPGRRSEPVDPGELVIENIPQPASGSAAQRGRDFPPRGPETVDSGGRVPENGSNERLAADAAPAPDLVRTTATAPSAEARPKTKRPDKRRRKRRPLPAYILDPAIGDAAAVVSMLTAPLSGGPAPARDEEGEDDDDWEDVEFELQVSPTPAPPATPWEDTELEYALTEAPSESPPPASGELVPDLRGTEPAQHRARRRRPNRGDDAATAREPATESE